MHATEWLKKTGGDFPKLKEQLGIKSTFSGDDRVILNYTQFDSPKDNEIVRECRALTLNRFSFELIARAFPRFFNAGECLHITKKFDWNNCTATDKVDGSLILVYLWHNQWRIQTRGSFAEGCPTEECPYTWQQLVEKSLPPYFFDSAQKHLTYILELCTPYNQVVQRHADYKTYLIGLYSGETEVVPAVREAEERLLGFPTLKTHSFKDIMDVQAYVADEARKDSTFEGVVLRDVNGLRLKVKSEKYVALARQFNNGNVYLTKNLVPLILDGEVDEVLTYFPDAKPKIENLQAEINKLREEADNLWFCYQDEPSQKKFALAVKDSRVAALLFKARKSGGHPWNYVSSEFLLKIL